MDEEETRREAEEKLPWEAEPEAGEEGRTRADGFTGLRKKKFLAALAKTGCLLDACRIVGVSARTVYNHQASDAEFERHCRLAREMGSMPLELTAYERAVVGIEEDVIRGGQVVGTRVRRSDYMLRLLLQGANPKKYGPRPGFTRKRLLRHERKQIEREVRADIEEKPMTFDEAIEQLDQRLEAVFGPRDERRLAAGWVRLGRSVWIPPGWVWTGEGDPEEFVARDEAEENPDAV